MRTRKFLLVSAVLVLMVSAVSAQGWEKKVEVDGDAGEVYFLMGPQAAMRETGDGLLIDFVAPADQRAKDYAKVDLKAGDIIMMINGKRAKKVAEIEEIIKELEVGETIKLGVKRDRDMMIVSFAKPDPEKAGGPMMMVTKTVGGDGKVDTDIKMAGPDLENSVILMEAGVILSNAENCLAVGVVIGNAETDLDGDAPGDGDVIVSINGKAVSTNAEFSAVYEAAAPGDELTLVYLHDGEEKTVKFKKSAEQPKMMIHKG